MVHREVLINIRVTDRERKMLHAVAHAADETAAQLVRRFIKQRYAAEFGEADPDGVAPLKAAGGSR